jgi:transcriptional regulator with XRE-family HTH domain
MEFHEKLAELRKSKGLTQEELAGALYVSRTAVSKWESGRGYPSIDSLKEISRYFSVTIDELICSQEMITAAEDDKKVMIGRYVAVICNTLDLLTAVLLFLPIFGNGADSPTSVSLFQITGTAPWAKAVFIAVIGIITLNGLCGVILSRFDRPVWNRHRMVTGMALSVAAVGIFIGTRQPYAGIICFAILVIKGWLIFKGKTEAAGQAD